MGIGNTKLIGILFALTVLAILSWPVYAAGNAAENATSTNASMNKTVVVGISATNMAFNTSTITVPAGTNVTINFDNQDAGVRHNVAVYQDQNAAQTIYKGEVITGPMTTTYTFTAPSTPGTYFFRCDIHPRTMTGQFIVE